MEQSTEIRCPKCNSSQLHVANKGFSIGKAVGGALLTGGIGALAGLHGSKDIVITCIACGNKFKAGEGKIIKHGSGEQEDFVDKRVKEIAVSDGILKAILYYKDSANVDLSTAKKYVENILEQNNITPKKQEGCFIATACYGDYECNEVVILRKYRDNVLDKNIFGKLFIKIYYSISPYFAKKIERSDKSKIFIRKHLLSKIINRLQ